MFVMFIIVNVCVMCVYHSTCMVVRGQLSEVGSLLLWFLGTGLRLSDLLDNGLYTLSHFTWPLFVCLFILYLNFETGSCCVVQDGL